MEAERLLYNAALQEWRDSYAWAIRKASALGMERPARWRLVELAREAGISVEEDALPDDKRKARLKLLAGHKAAWAAKPAQRAKAVIARDKVVAANAELMRGLPEGADLPAGLRPVPRLPARQALMAEGLDGASLTPRQRAALVDLLAWRSPSFMSQDEVMSVKAQRAVGFEPLHAVAANQRRHTLRRLHGAIQGFYDRVNEGGAPGFPRFKAMGRWTSFGYHEMSGARLVPAPATAHVHPSGKAGRWKAAKGRLTLAGVGGSVDVHMHRPLPDGAEVRGLTLSLEGGTWYATFRCRVPVLVGVETDAQLADVTDAQVHGLDWGVINTFAASDGRITANPRLGRGAEERVETLQQRLSRCKPGSNARRKARLRLAAAQRDLANARDTHAHQVSSREVKAALEAKCRAVAMEDGDLTNLTRSARGTVEAPGRMVQQKAGYNRAQLDAVPGTIRSYVAYKAARAGLRPVMVPPHGSSQTCSKCGAAVPKELSERVHACPVCETVLDRDVNGSLNHSRRGAEMLRAGVAPSWRTEGRKARRAAESATVEAGSEVAEGGRAKPRTRRKAGREPPALAA